MSCATLYRMRDAVKAKMSRLGLHEARGAVAEDTSSFAFVKHLVVMLPSAPQLERSWVESTTRGVIKPLFASPSLAVPSSSVDRAVFLDFARGCRYLVVFWGAGFSADSGIPVPKAAALSRRARACLVRIRENEVLLARHGWGRSPPALG